MELTKREQRAFGQAIRALRKTKRQQVFGHAGGPNQTGCAMYVIRMRHCDRVPLRGVGKGALAQFYLQDWSNVIHLECSCHERSGIRCNGLQEAIIHLNDTHRWTFNKIADWLEEFAAAPEKHLVSR